VRNTYHVYMMRRDGSQSTEMPEDATRSSRQSAENAEPRGRPPQNRAVMKHVGYLGGLDYLAANYRKQDFPKHVHEEYLIGLIERGVHDVWCRGELWHAAAGSIATFAPGEPHSGGAGAELGWSQKIFYLPERLIRAHSTSRIRSREANTPRAGSISLGACWKTATARHWRLRNISSDSCRSSSRRRAS